MVETTLSGHGALRLMDKARAAGYRIELHYVSAGSVEQTLDRISNRVALGGHNVREDDVRRRFDRGRTCRQPLREPMNPGSTTTPTSMIHTVRSQS